MHTHTNYRWLRACTVNSLRTLHIYEKVFHHRKGDIIAFAKVSVDKSCATTSTWKPGPGPGPGAVSFK